MSRSQITQELLMSVEAVGKADTHYSAARRFSDCAGQASLFIKSTAGSITVTQQCSLDGINFYDPIDTAAGALGAVIATQTVTTGIYVSFTPIICEYARFKVVEQNSAATSVTLHLSYRLEV
jgi:hypothetical protein